MNKSCGLFQATGVITLIVSITYTMCIGWTIVPFIFIIPMIISGVKFLNYADMTPEDFELHRNNAIGWGLFLLIFCTFSGILGLLAINQLPETESNSQNYYHDNYTNNDDISSIDTQEKIEKLERLLSLKERQVISDQEYEDLKRKILKE